MRCLEKDPVLRPQTAEDVKRALLAVEMAGPHAARRRLSALLGVVAVIFAATLVVFVLAPRLLTWRVMVVPPERAAIKSIAVLPIENVAGDSTAYFADGITDELVAALAKVPGLRVAPRTSVLYFKGRNLNTTQIGESLHVAAVLEGRVRRDEGTVRVNAQLTSTSDGLSLWSEQFQRERAGVFAMQDDITRAIVNALRLTIGATSSAGRGAGNAAAHDLYLKGRYFWDQRTRAGLTTATRYFGDAVRLDSTYALAYAGLADSWALLGTFGYLSPSSAYPKALQAAQRAVQLDSTLAEPHSSLCHVATFYEWDWEKADREFTRAATLDSTYATTFLFRAWLRLLTGRGADALASLRHARELEPLSKIINARVGTMLFFLRRYDEAVDEMRSVLALDPAFFVTKLELSNALTMLGRYDEALRYASTGADAVADRTEGDLAYLYGRTGRRAKIAPLIASMRAARAREFTPALSLALAYLSVGDTSAVLTELERAATNRDWGVAIAGQDPRFAPLWSHPRFLASRRVMHLEGVSPGAARP